MATPGGPRPGNVPPNYNPNSIAYNMQNLQLNHPNRPLTSGGGGGPRPPPPGIVPRGTMPPPGVVPRSAMPPPSGPPQGALPPFMVNRPNSGGDPPSSNQPPSFVSRPMPPGPSPLTATSTHPGSSGPPPGAPMRNGPPAFGPGGMQDGPNNLPGGIRSRPSAVTPPPRQTMSPAAAVPSFSGQSMHSGSGSQFNNPQLGPRQPAPPFSAPPSGIQPSAGPPSFSTQSQAMPQPQWRMQSHQFVLQQYDNPLSKKLNEAKNEIRSQRCNYLRLKLFKKGDPSGLNFRNVVLLIYG